MTRICMISDTHEQERQVQVPKCDILIHAGDFTYTGKLAKVREFNTWCASLLEKGTVSTEIIAIAGNHDLTFESHPEDAENCLQDVTYLRDSATTVNGLKIYGSPWQPRFHDWAFNLDRGPMLKGKWDQIPLDTDILVTHGPPYGIGDETEEHLNVGCLDLLDRVKLVKPKIHVFGHIHEGAGLYQRHGTVFVNASSCNRKYSPANPPIVIDV